jgi:hypothetical protein
MGLSVKSIFNFERPASNALTPINFLSEPNMRYRLTLTLGSFAKLKQIVDSSYCFINFNSRIIVLFSDSVKP